MTAEKSIKIIEVAKAECEWNAPLDYQEAFALAIEALEKQIPKKPTIKQDKYNENLCTLYCPTCGSYIGMYNKRLKMSDFYNNTNREICAKCGQMIDCEVEG